MFKPVTVVLNFEYKEDFDMFFNMVSYNVIIPNMVSEGSKTYQADYNHCQKLLTAIHSAMRKYKENV